MRHRPATGPTEPPRHDVVVRRAGSRRAGEPGDRALRLGETQSENRRVKAALAHLGATPDPDRSRAAPGTDR